MTNVLESHKTGQGHAVIETDTSSFSTWFIPYTLEVVDRKKGSKSFLTFRVPGRWDVLKVMTSWTFLWFTDSSEQDSVLVMGLILTVTLTLI